jgi:hypothetical protein
MKKKTSLKHKKTRLQKHKKYKKKKLVKIYLWFQKEMKKIIDELGSPRAGTCWWAE